MKLDPRVKLLIIVLLTTLAVLSKDIAYLSIISLISIIWVLLLQIDIIKLLFRLKHLIWLILFISIVQSLCLKGGTSLIVINNVNLLTTYGLQFGVEFILRMGIIIFAGAISQATNATEMMDGMYLLKVPYTLLFMANIALRYMPLFRDEFKARLNAVSIRGIDIKSLHLHKKIQLYSYLISPTISGAILKSEKLAESVNARGFRAYKKRTMLNVYKFKCIDYIVVVLMIFITAIFLGCMYHYGILIKF